jgi:hypothetical protein
MFWQDFIGNMILGKQLSATFDNIPAMFKPFSSPLRKDKLLIVVNECNLSDFKGRINDIKSMVDGREIIVNQKYQPMYVRDNYARMAMFSQDEYFVPLETCDRR